MVLDYVWGHFLSGAFRWKYWHSSSPTNDVTKDGPNLVVSEGDSGPRNPGATTVGLKHRALI